MTPQEFANWGETLSTEFWRKSKGVYFKDPAYDYSIASADEVQNMAQEVAGFLDTPGVPEKLAACAALGQAVRPPDTVSLESQQTEFTRIYAALDAILLRAHQDAWLGEWDTNSDGTLGTLFFYRIEASYEADPQQTLRVRYNDRQSTFVEGLVTGVSQRWQHLQFHVGAVGDDVSRDFDAYLFQKDKRKMAGVHHARVDCGFFATKRLPPGTAQPPSPPAAAASLTPPPLPPAIPPPPPVPPAMPRSTRGGLGGMITVLIGCALLLLAGWLYQRASTFAAHAVHTQGTVVAHGTNYNSRTRKTYYSPIFTFTDGAGKEWKVESAAPDNYRPEIGSKIPILYNPDNPAEAEVDSFSATHGYSMIVAVIGGVVTACGGLAIWNAQLKLAETIRAEVKPPANASPPPPPAVSPAAGDEVQVFEHGTEADLEAFVSGVRTDRPVEIRLRGSYWRPNSCRIIARLPAGAEIHTLSARGAPILDAGASILAALKPIQTARSLAFERCGVTDRFIIALFRQDKPRLRTLSLGNPDDLPASLPNKVTFSVNASLPALNDMASLETLNVENTDLSDHGGACIAAAEGLPRLGHIYAKRCRFTPQGLLKIEAIEDKRRRARQVRGEPAIRRVFYTDFDGQDLRSLIPPETPSRPRLDPTECWRQLLAAPGDADLRARYVQALSDAGDWRADVLKRAPTASQSKNSARILQNQTERWRDRFFGEFLQKWGAQLFFADGWPVGLTISARNFTQHAAEIVATLPLRHLNLKAVNDAPEVFGVPSFSQVATLKASGQSWSSQAVAALAASSQTSGLHWLDLSKTGLRDEQVETLAASPNLKALEVLHLAGNPCRNPVDEANGYGTDGITGRITPESVSLPEFGRELESRHGNLRWLHVLDHFGPLPPERYRF